MRLADLASCRQSSLRLRTSSIHLHINHSHSWLTSTPPLSNQNIITLDLHQKLVSTQSHHLIILCEYIYCRYSLVQCCLHSFFSQLTSCLWVQSFTHSLIMNSTARSNKIRFESRITYNKSSSSHHSSPSLQNCRDQPDHVLRPAGTSFRHMDSNWTVLVFPHASLTSRSPPILSPRLDTQSDLICEGVILPLQETVSLYIFCFFFFFSQNKSNLQSGHLIIVLCKFSHQSYLVNFLPSLNIIHFLHSMEYHCTWTFQDYRKRKWSMERRSLDSQVIHPSLPTKITTQPKQHPDLHHK